MSILGPVLILFINGPVPNVSINGPTDCVRKWACTGFVHKDKWAY